MSNTQQQFSAGQTHGHAQAKTEEWIQSAQNTTNAARDEVSNASQSGQEQSGGFLQQTGEKMVNLAQGAVDGVKNTLGMGDNNNNNNNK
ncbi:hypothetical protein JRO89_XS03G0075300 [Xanthoceras sorbifolium]|uniref:Uncharacterized protein n=1 Tax=Xanthoceras sorbifolium TaxID=99658 RepID=A0ABQ8I938_9ROSI|nr:hypothetical protein JRO89_XS03G0075300 [Xanthoceras sorbifolium]